MLNVYGAVFVYLLILAITIFNYVRHAEKLIIYHKYSIFVDVLSWIGGIILIGIVVNAILKEVLIYLLVI